jgi:hypothetical protein
VSDEHAAEHATEAVEHLQRAAVEMIKATRAFLDLAEDVLGDPAPLLDLLGGLAARGRAAAGSASAGGSASAERAERDDPSGGVQHIRVS